MFKETFKYYKSKCPPPNYGNVIDFDQIDSDSDNIVTVRLPVKCTNRDEYRIRGLLPPDQWKIYEIRDRPGLIFIKNPLTKRGQRYWIARCLRDYPNAPHAVNLNEKYFSKQVIDNWWQTLQNASTGSDAKEKLRLKNGMRWTTLGYHHDWDTKIYAEDKKHDFPDDLATLNAYFADVLGFGPYSAEAAIVNFYPLGTTLAGHTDHSEKNLKAPLFSISFGQTAIFLIGGETKEEKPSAIFLKSGDIVVMSEESRLCYHAVPKIIETDVAWISAPIQMANGLSENVESNKQHDANIETKEMLSNERKKRRLTVTSQNELLDDGFAEDIWDLSIDQEWWKPFAAYISDCRININVRQVLEPGEKAL